MQVLWSIQVLFGLLAIGFGVFVLRGVLRAELGGIQVVRFLRCSLIAALVGILPFTGRLSSIQGICMVSVYCSGIAVLAWRKFCLAGFWRSVFVFLMVAVLYLNIVAVSTRLYSRSVLCALASREFGTQLEETQFLIGLAFAVLGALAVKIHHTHLTH